MPTASHPRLAAAIAALPLPVATSSTRHPAWMSAVSHRCSAWKTIREATTEKSPLAQVFCCRPFTAAKSGARLGAASTAGLMRLVLQVSGELPIKSTTDRSFDSTYGRAIMSSRTDQDFETGSIGRGEGLRNVKNGQQRYRIAAIGRGKARGAEAAVGRRGEPSHDLTRGRRTGDHARAGRPLHRRTSPAHRHEQERPLCPLQVERGARTGDD